MPGSKTYCKGEGRYFDSSEFSFNQVWGLIHNTAEPHTVTGMAIRGDDPDFPDLPGYEGIELPEADEDS